MELGKEKLRTEGKSLEISFTLSLPKDSADQATELPAM